MSLTTKTTHHECGGEVLVDASPIPEFFMCMECQKQWPYDTKEKFMDVHHSVTVQELKSVDYVVLDLNTKP